MWTKACYSRRVPNVNSGSIFEVLNKEYSLLDHALWVFQGLVDLLAPSLDYLYPFPTNSVAPHYSYWLLRIPVLDAVEMKGVTHH